MLPQLIVSETECTDPSRIKFRKRTRKQQHGICSRPSLHCAEKRKHLATLGISYSRCLIKTQISRGGDSGSTELFRSDIHVSSSVRAKCVPIPLFYLGGRAHRGESSRGPAAPLAIPVVTRTVSPPTIPARCQQQGVVRELGWTGSNSGAMDETVNLVGSASYCRLKRDRRGLMETGCSTVRTDRIGTCSWSNTRWRYEKSKRWFQIRLSAYYAALTCRR